MVDKVSSSRQQCVVYSPGRHIQWSERWTAEPCRSSRGSGHREAPSQLHPGSSPAQTRYDVSPQHGGAAPWGSEHKAPPGNNAYCLIVSNSSFKFFHRSRLELADVINKNYTSYYYYYYWNDTHFLLFPYICFLFST